VKMWSNIVTLLLLGYLCMGRSFAYLGIPSLHLFVGEAVLGLFLVFFMVSYRATALRNAMNDSRLKPLRKIFMIFLAFGAFQVFRGIFSGNPPLLALRDLALNYYPIYFALGLWVGLLDPEYLSRFFRLAAWANGIYGLLYIVLLSRVAWSFPGFSDDSTPVPIFGQPSYSALILLGLLSFQKDLRRVLPLLLLNTAVLLGMLIRAEWVALVIGILIWAWFTKNLKRVALAAAMVPLLLVLMYVTNFSIPAPETRGGTVSATEIAARVLAPINADFADQYGSDNSDLNMYEGTTAWRTTYWLLIWTTVHENMERTLLGYGYGYPLNDLLPDLFGNTRTPHDVFFYVLAYTGWVGVAIFALLQLQLVRVLRSVCRLRDEPFGIVFWGALLMFALFTPFFETPQGAIPFYLLAGCVCASLFRARNKRSVPANPKLILAPSEGV